MAVTMVTIALNMLPARGSVASRDLVRSRDRPAVVAVVAMTGNAAMMGVVRGSGPKRR